ncbi:MAG: 2TM domain-containing protein [Ginsengibacter sp.]
MDIETKDPDLWKVAQKRAAFKYHVLIYFIMNIFFWTLWYISLRNNSTPPADRDIIPWPVWPMVGWGIGVLFNYVGVYRSRNTLAEKEYEKLKNKHHL